MTQEESSSTPGQQFAPPTDPGEISTPQRPSNWPTVIGIIAIVFGALGILGGLWNAAAVFMVDTMASMMPPGQADTFEVMREWRVWTVVFGLMAAVLAVLLLAAGIGLLQRKRGSVQLSRTWAVLKMLFVVGNSVFGYLVQQGTLAALAQQDPNFGKLPGQFIGVIGVFTIVFIIIWGWALPVFMLIWLSRKKVKADVSRWTPGGRGV